jgi:anti-sigma B factor antagonist
MAKKGDTIVVKCENCGKKLKTKKRHLGRKGRCPSCGSVIKLTESNDGKAKGEVERVVQKDDVEGGESSMLQIQRHDDVGVVSFRTSRILDQSNVQQLGDELEGLVDEHNFDKVAINFDKIQYMSSAVMGKLVSLHKKLEASGGALRLCNIGPEIYEIFEIMRFDKLFDICDTEDDAVIELME